MLLGYLIKKNKFYGNIDGGYIILQLHYFANDFEENKISSTSSSKKRHSSDISVECFFGKAQDVEILFFNRWFRHMCTGMFINYGLGGGEWT